MHLILCGIILVLLGTFYASAAVAVLIVGIKLWQWINERF